MVRGTAAGFSCCCWLPAWVHVPAASLPAACLPAHLPAVGSEPTHWLEQTRWAGHRQQVACAVLRCGAVPASQSHCGGGLPKRTGPDLPCCSPSAMLAD